MPRARPAPRAKPPNEIWQTCCCADFHLIHVPQRTDAPGTPHHSDPAGPGRCPAVAGPRPPPTRLSATDADPISFVGGSRAAANLKVPSVTVPTPVQAGDTLLLTASLANVTQRDCPGWLDPGGRPDRRHAPVTRLVPQRHGRDAGTSVKLTLNAHPQGRAHAHRLPRRRPHGAGFCQGFLGCQHQHPRHPRGHGPRRLLGGVLLGRQGHVHDALDDPVDSQPPCGCLHHGQWPGLGCDR